MELRSHHGMEVVALGPGAAPILMKRLREGRVIGLLCDRDIEGTGIPVTLLGEPTTMSAGPAMLALRTGAAVVPTAAVFTPDDRIRGIIGAPLEITRTGSLRADVATLTQAIADALSEPSVPGPISGTCSSPTGHRTVTGRRPPARPPQGADVRIGMFSPYSLTLPGGVQGQVLGLARALRARGHEVRVLGPCDGPPPEAGVTPLGNSLPTAANGSVAPIAPDASATLRTIRALRDEEFELLHLHEPLAPGPTTTALIFHPCPIVGTFHAAGASAPYRYLGRWIRWMSRRIDVCCAVSDDAVALAQGVVGGEFLQLFNGIEVDRFATAVPWPSEGPTILFVGRHEQRKGLAVLLDTLPKLPDDVTLWVAGSGPETDELRHRHPDPRVQWLGRITDTELARRFAGATVYCAPSLGGESFGVVLLEAMAAGTPVVASSIDGYRNVATDGLDALLTPPGDAGALAQALVATLAGGPEVAARVEAARQRAAGYSMAALAEAYEGIYEDLLRRTRRTPRRR